MSRSPHSHVDAPCPVSEQTLREERINVWTHGAGLVFAIVAAIALIGLAAARARPVHVVGAVVFGASMVLLYLASTVYHATRQLPRKRLLRRLDHIGIYLLIAGSYTPFALGPLRGTVGGWPLLLLIWACALIGTAHRALGADTQRGGSLKAYLAMGWLALAALGPLSRALPPASFALLLAGGLTYTAGTVFYAWRGLPFGHGVWHLFVLGGTVCHALAVADYLATGPL